MRSYLNVFRGVFEHHPTGFSSPAIFAMSCWLKSVHILQGNRFISRCYSLAKYAVWNIYDQVEVFQKHKLLLNFDPLMCIAPLQQVLETAPILNMIEPFVKNPIISASLVLDVGLHDLM